MSSRNYNKLYVHTDREEGSEKLILGYENDTRDIVLTKDQETSFHIPPYSKSIKLIDSSLVINGATAGGYPAASDRIYKNQMGYGNVTSNGETPSSVSNGMWFCSWLYKDPSGRVQWMDRYYEPGMFVYQTALCELFDEFPYKKSNPVYKDVVSTMTLDAGCHYKYFHVGENTVANIVSTFGGLSGELLQMHLNDWTPANFLNFADANYYTGIDISNNKLVLEINTAGDALPEGYPVQIFENDRLPAPMLRLDVASDITVEIPYNKNYCLTNELSWSVHLNNFNWKRCRWTQIIGNFTEKGGIGIFIDNLNSFPYFVVPETGYGHLLYFNENRQGFLDKSTQLTPILSCTPGLVAVDMNHHVISWNTDYSGVLFKFDNTGQVLQSTTLPLNETNIARQLICGPNNSIVAITSNAHYYYDEYLVLQNIVPHTSSEHTVSSYSYNSTDGSCELISLDNVFDSKFIETTNWCISADGNLYTKAEEELEHKLVLTFDDIATEFAVDPMERLWILHGNNKCTIYDIKTNTKSEFFEIGVNAPHARKNITFIYEQNRTNKTQEWRCLIYFADDAYDTPNIYVYNMESALLDKISIYSAFDISVIRDYKQSEEKFRFLSKGDFSGYEAKRVNKMLPPYYNKSQLIVKASLKDRSTDSIKYKTITNYTPIDSWTNRSWYHVVLTHANNTFKVYVDGKLMNQFSYSGQYEISYEIQPSFFVGTPAGTYRGFNREIQNTSALYNGIIQDIRIYSYVLERFQIELLHRFFKVAQDINWNLPTPSIQYIEQVERMFKNKIPGAKSAYFNLKIGGTQITNEQAQALIEQEIRLLMSELKPEHTSFLGIQWVE